MNALNSTELYIFKLLILSDIDFTSIKKYNLGLGNVKHTEIYKIKGETLLPLFKGLFAGMTTAKCCFYSLSWDGGKGYAHSSPYLYHYPFRTLGRPY